MASFDFDISIPQLRCFITVVEAGSIAEAGRRLGTSAASVSKAIARLEQSVGARLLHRSTHALSLTEEGEALLGPARQVLFAAQGFQDVATAAGGGIGKGIVRVSAPVAFVRHMLAPLIPGFVKLHPEIRLDIRASNELIDLADQAIDLAVRSGPLTGIPGHIQQMWFSFPWVICAAPSYLEDRPRPHTPEELERHVLIGFRNRRTGQVQNWPITMPAGVPAKPFPGDAQFVFDDGDAACAAMLAGVGIACAPLWLVAADLRSERLVELLKECRGNEVSMSFVRRERDLTPGRVSTVISYLRARAPQLGDLL